MRFGAMMDLHSQRFLFIDCQTTATHPSQGELLELSWCMTSLNDRPSSTLETHLIQLPEGKAIPRLVREMTGITDHEMASAKPVLTVLEALKSQIQAHSEVFAVAHYATFEKTFLEAAFKEHFPEEKISLNFICTQKLSKLLFPRMTSYNMRAISGFFGPALHLDNRASSHAEATVMIWQELVKELHKREIFSVAALEELLKAKKPATKKEKAKKTQSFQYRMERDKRLQLPDEPGVYKMLSQDGTVLYVGKATSLKSRVNSYFRGINHRDRRKLEMMAQVWDIQVTTCATPLEAALLESDEIKKLKPRYNVALRGSRKPVFFLGRDLVALSTEYSSEHPIGPLRSRERLEQVQMVWEFLQSGHWGQPFFDFVEPTLIQSGWDEFCGRHSIEPDDFSSLRDMVACGTWLWRKKKVQAYEVSEVEHEAVPEELSARDVADKFERMFIGAAHSLWRAQRMWKLLSAKIQIRDKSGKESELFMVDGMLTTESEWKAHGHQRKKSSPVIDSAIYDRLSIILTGIQSSESHKVESFI